MNSSSSEGTGATGPTPVTVNTPNYADTLDSTSEKIKKSEEFNQCMNMNVNMCINMAGTQIAQKTQSLEFCDELGNNDQIESCKFGILINKSQSDKDIKLCDKLSATYANRCKSEFYKGEAIRMKDVKLCGKIGINSGSGNMDLDINSRDIDQCIMSVIMSDGSKKAEDCDIIKDE
jgi:hypothetical protein